MSLEGLPSIPPTSVGPTTMKTTVLDAVGWDVVRNQVDYSLVFSVLIDGHVVETIAIPLNPDVREQMGKKLLAPSIAAPNTMPNGRGL